MDLDEHEAILKTNDEALACRICGLLPDPVARHFSPQVEQQVHSPLIKRGTFIRTRAIDNSLLSIINETPNVQIVVLGAGFDTRWHRLYSQLNSVSRYLEIDFPEIVRKKLRTLSKVNFFNDSRYSMSSNDLVMCNLDSILREAGFSPKITTVVIAECCLMYLPMETVCRLVDSLGSFSFQVHTIIYDSLFIRNDNFSLLMVDNFSRRKIELNPFWVDSIEDLKSILFSSWKVTFFMSMKEVEGSKLMIPEDRAMLSKHLALDEYEEWNLVADHYYFAHFTMTNIL